MNEIVTGFEFRPAPWWMTRIAGIARLDKSLMAVTNPGVPFSSYTRTHVIDPGVDIDGGNDHAAVADLQPRRVDVRRRSLPADEQPGDPVDVHGLRHHGAGHQGTVCMS